MSEVAERFGENLIRCRRRVGLSQEEVAVRACLHRTEIGHLEHGRRLPRIDTAIKLAAAIEAEIGELVEGSTGSAAATPRAGRSSRTAKEAISQKAAEPIVSHESQKHRKRRQKPEAKHGLTQGHRKGAIPGRKADPKQQQQTPKRSITECRHPSRRAASGAATARVPCREDPSPTEPPARPAVVEHPRIS